MRLSLACILIICLFSIPRSLFAQKPTDPFTDSLVKKFTYYRLKKQDGVLFAHFDKTIYTNNENVWFTAYLLKAANIKTSDVLSVILVKDNDRSIVIEEKFAMADNISFGNIFLPDTIEAGDYSFMLYTNKVYRGKPADVFIQPVTIKNTREISFNAFLQLIDTGKAPVNGTRKVLLVTDTKSPKILSGAAVSYFAGNKQDPVASGKVRTNKAGQYLFTIPVKDMDINNNTLEVTINSGKEIKNLNLILPTDNAVPIVRFYPEGGSLSDNIKSAVGWEVKNKAGNPYKVTGVLFEQGIAIDTIATNSYGMGRFWLTPQKESKYYIKLLLPDYKESTYNLPKIQTGTPVITIQNAVAGDTLRLIIKNNVNAKVYVNVHNYWQLFFSFPVTVNQGGRPIKILLTDIPKGLSAITVLDSLYRPCAERLFFAHYNQRDALKINTDKTDYKTRQQVNLNLKLSTPDSTPITGFVSIACVQANRLELKKAKDIESYFYLEHELGQMPVKENYMGNTTVDKAFIDEVLLIKGWRRYSWKDLYETTPADTVKQQDLLNFKGNVTYFDKPLKKPVILVLLRDSLLGLNTVTTRINGSFNLSNESLYTYQDKKINVLVSGESMEGYNININDPYVKINNAVAQSCTPAYYNRFIQNTNNDNDENLKGLEHVIHLKEVKIKAKNDDALYGFGPLGPNDCGDYVCVYHILNCPNHRGDFRNTAPVEGQTYIYNGMPGYVYSGCKIGQQYKSNKAINGIYYAMQFYPADYLQYNPSAPEYVSTIYWKHLYKITPGKETTVKFFTSDITGAFKIIVQGVSTNDVIYGEKSFFVSKQ